MFQKRFKQFMAATLSAAMLMGQVQYAYAADVEDTDLIFVSEDEEVSAAAEEASEEASEDASEDELVIDVDEASEAASDEATEDVSDDVAVASEDASEDAATAASSEEAAELPEGVVGMPEGYELTSQELELKEDSINHKDDYDRFITLEEGIDYVKDEVIFLSETQEHAEEVAAAYDGKLKSFEYGVAVIDLSESDLSVAEAYECSLVEDAEIPAVFPNYYYQIEDPIVSEGLDETYLTEAEEDEAEFMSAGSWQKMHGNDPMLNPASGEYQWHHDMIETYDAWEGMGNDLSKTTGVKVAVIDSGVTSHGDLTVSGPSSSPRSIHATHVAGIIAAKRNNGTGGAGVAPGAQIINYQCTLTDADINSCIKKASDGGAWIINMSFGGHYRNSATQTVINQAYNNNVTLVAAMGNEYSNDLAFPAGFDHVIAVAAVKEDGHPTAFTTRGSWCDIAAPGANIWSTLAAGGKSEAVSSGLTVSKDGTYVTMDGTSMASPVVAGACALYMAKYGHVKPAAMEAALKASATKMSESGMGAGLLNVRKLLGISGSDANHLTTKSYTISKIALNADKATLKTDETKALSVSSLATSNGKSLMNESISYEWVSSNTNVATVSGSGKSATVTAHVPGTAKITCKAKTASMKSAKTVTCTITVNAKGTAKVVGSVTLHTKATDSSHNLKTAKNGDKTPILKSATVNLGGSHPSLSIYADFYGAGKNAKKLSYSTPLWTSSDSKIVKVTGNGASATVTGLKKGSATITCLAQDGSGKKATVKIDVRQVATSVTVQGQPYVALGGKATYKATVDKDASPATIKWTYTGVGSSKIKIDEKKGTLNVPKDAPTGSGTVRATVLNNDGKTVYKDFAVTIRNKKTTNLTLSASGSTTLGVQAVGSFKKQVTLTATTDCPNVTWTASNDSIVSIAPSGNKVTVTAKAAGSATVTANANDGSGKKASMTIKVVVPAAGISLVPPKDRGYFVAVGSSLALTPVFTSTYGKVTNTKVEWDCAVYYVDNSGKRTRLSKSDAATVATFKNGKITPKAAYSDIDIVVTATALDGSGMKASQQIYVVSKNKAFGIFNKYGQKVNVLTVPLTGDDRYYKLQVNTSGAPFSVTSSNPEILTGYYEGGYLCLVTRKKGTVNITLKMLDGSNATYSTKAVVK